MQPDLFAGLNEWTQAIATEEVEGESIEDRFKSFHDLNPHVYEALRQLAFEMVSTGRKRYTITGLYEVLRWHYSLQTSGDNYKLNNNYRACYARKLMDEEPLLEGFFVTRTRASDR